MASKMNAKQRLPAIPIRKEEGLSPAHILTVGPLIELARSQRMSLTALICFAESLSASGKKADAARLYKNWIAFNEAHPLLHLAYFNYAATLRQLDDIEGAILALQASLKIDPQFGQGHINLGRALEDAGLLAQAAQQWRSYVEFTGKCTPDQVLNRLMALQHIGRVMENAGLLDEAEAALRQAIELRPDKTEASQHWSALRQRQCKWPILLPSEYVSKRQLLDAMSPLALACYSDDPMFQLAKAYRYNKTLVGHPNIRGFSRKTPKRKGASRQRLRVGYVSSDLRDHAVGFALREVLELHDKERVEIYAYYCGEPVAKDETQARIKTAVRCWRDIAALSDEEAARRISDDDVDILVDVNGYTKHARARIFAYRPAPVIVNFCGYPGSMGSPFHQYIIADEHIIPPESEVYYSEKVLRIPCTQPIDRKRAIAEPPSRTEAGLPDDVFVFACFNGAQKITEVIFGLWMKILKAAPKAVLWLLGENDDVNKRLQSAAEIAGIAPERLVFALKAPNAKHLARFALADLFLDTFPYGAHSTAADALTMGLPVLTVPGKTFAARFCHSIVLSAHAPELICRDFEDYVQKAITFGANPGSLQPIRGSLIANRDASVLRDIPTVARRLEELFHQMKAECDRGETPTPDLRNLDIYYEIGAELIENNMGFQDDYAYRSQYMEKLVQWNDYSPIPSDGRFWRNSKVNGGRIARSRPSNSRLAQNELA